MSGLMAPVHSNAGVSDAATGRFDRVFGLLGLVVAVATIGFGLGAQATGYEWMVWVAAGLVALGLVGVIRDSLRYLVAFQFRPGFGWFLGSWLVLVAGLMAAALVAGDSVGLFSMSGLRSMVGSEIAVPSVASGVGLALASAGLLRGRLRSDQHAHLLASGFLAVAGAAVLIGGIMAWLAPVTIGELEREADVHETESGVLRVIEVPAETSEGGFGQFELRAYGYEGTGDPASEGWDQWIVVAVDQSTGEDIEVLYGPASEEAASQRIGELEMASRAVIFEGTEAEVQAWLQDEGSGYKDHLVPAFLVLTGILLVGSAVTVSPRRRQEITG